MKENTQTQIIVNGSEIDMNEVIKQIRKQGLLKNIIQGILLDNEINTIEISQERKNELVKGYMQERKLVSEEEFKNNTSEEKIINEELLVEILTQPERVVKYRERRWGDIINTLYLKKKEKYNLVTYYKIEGNNIEVLYEIYFRIKDGEETWEQIARKMRGGNQHSSAKFGPEVITNMQRRLVEKLKSLKLNEVSRPFSYNNAFAIVSPIEYTGGVLNEEIKQKLLKEEFEDWINDKTQRSLSNTKITQKRNPPGENNGN